MWFTVGIGNWWMAAKHDMDDGTEALKCMKCDDEMYKAVVRSNDPIQLLWPI